MTRSPILRKTEVDDIIDEREGARGSAWDTKIHPKSELNYFKLGDMRVGGFRVIAITNITDSCYYTHNPSLSSWRGTSEKSKRS